MIESHLGPGGVRLRPLGLVQRLENSSLWQQNKAQPSICVIFNNSCRENVFKARTSSLVYASEVSPQPQRPPGGQGLSPLSLSLSHFFPLFLLLILLCVSPKKSSLWQQLQQIKTASLAGWQCENFKGLSAKLIFHHPPPTLPCISMPQWKHHNNSLSTCNTPLRSERRSLPCPSNA